MQDLLLLYETGKTTVLFIKWARGGARGGGGQKKGRFDDMGGGGGKFGIFLMTSFLDSPLWELSYMGLCGVNRCTCRESPSMNRFRSRNSRKFGVFCIKLLIWHMNMAT